MLRSVLARGVVVAIALPVMVTQPSFADSHESSTVLHTKVDWSKNTGSKKTNLRLPSQADDHVGEKIAVISGTASMDLGASICKELGTSLTDAEVTRFSDGEISVQINESMRGRDCFVVQTCASPVNDNIMELFLTVTAARRSGAASVTAVIPYYGYKHNRRRHALATPYNTRFLWSSSADLAKMLQTIGVDKIVSVDLQRPGQGHEACFFESTVPVETVTSNDAFVEYAVKNLNLNDRIVVLSPNTQNLKKANKFRKKLQSALPAKSISSGVFLSKTEGAAADKDSELLAEVNGADVIIVDELIDTATTLSNICRRLSKEGAKRIFVCASHGLFCNNSMQLIDLSPVEKVIVTDSIPLPKVHSKKVAQISMAPLLAKIIESDSRASIGKWDSDKSGEEIFDNTNDDETFEVE